MSAEHHRSPSSQLSPDGRWWWDGREWQPLIDRPQRSGVKWIVVTLVAVTGVVVLAAFVLLAALSKPLGEQHDSDELGRDYCAYFPEDC